MEEIKKSIEIEIWLDIPCPICFLGKRNLEIALDESDFYADISISWRSFILTNYNTMILDNDLFFHPVTRNSFNPEGKLDSMEQIIQMGKEAGIDFNLEGVIPVDSLKAHNLLHFASTKGLGSEVLENLFVACLSEGKDISDDQVLLALANDAGLEETETKRIIQIGKYNHKVNKDVYDAKIIDLRGLPFFLFNGKRAVPGAISVNAFKEVLKLLVKK